MSQPDELELRARQAIRARRQMRASADRLRQLGAANPELAWLAVYADQVGVGVDEVMTEVLRPEADGN